MSGGSQSGPNIAAAHPNAGIDGSCSTDHFSGNHKIASTQHAASRVVTRFQSTGSTSPCTVLGSRYSSNLSDCVKGQNSSASSRRTLNDSFFLLKTNTETHKFLSFQDYLRGGPASTLWSSARLLEQYAFQIYSWRKCVQRFCLLLSCSHCSCSSSQSWWNGRKAATRRVKGHFTVVTQADLSSSQCH